MPKELPAISAEAGLSLQRILKIGKMDIVSISIGHLRQGRAEPDGSFDAEKLGGADEASFLAAQVTLSFYDKDVVNVERFESHRS